MDLLQAKTTTLLEELQAPGGLDGWDPIVPAPRNRLLEELQAPGGLDGWELIVPAPRTPPALIAHVRLRLRLEAVHLGFIKRKRSAAWPDLLQEIREYKVERQERYDRAIAAWKELCFSDSDLD